MPVYNKAAHVARAVNSVLNQSHRDFELILVDDASIDDSLKIIKQFGDDRIRIIERKEPGPGGYKARNAGAKKANYEWISFLDADDEWESEYLATIDGLRNQFPQAKLLSTGWQDMYLGGYSRPDRYYLNKKYMGNHVYNVTDFLQAALAIGRPICSSVATIEKKLFYKAGMFPENGLGRGGDVDTWFRIMMLGTTGAWAAYQGAYYHRDSDNMTTQTVFPSIRENHLLRSINAHLQTEEDSELRALLKQYRRAIYRSTFKTKIELAFIHGMKKIFGPVISRSFTENLVKRKKSMEFKGDA
jgi:GT2 family glycosyltransferase